MNKLCKFNDNAGEWTKKNKNLTFFLRFDRLMTMTIYMKREKNYYYHHHHHHDGHLFNMSVESTGETRIEKKELYTTTTKPNHKS